MIVNEIFTHNQHFVDMMNIINEASENPPKEGHRHHIIPRCWFKKNNLEIDNSDKNLVLLSYEDHVKVHELAYHCTSGITKRNMAYAYHRLTEGVMVENGCFKGRTPWNKGKSHSLETIKKITESMKGEKNPWYGKKHSDATRKKMSEFHKGKVLSEEHRLKISESKKGKTTWNKGLKGESSGTKGKSWKLVDGKRIYSESKK